MNWLQSTLVNMIVPILTPILMSFVKKGADWLGQKLPKTMIPALAAAMGEGVSQLANMNGAGIPAGMGPFLGLAGVGIREIVDQWKTNGLLGTGSAPPNG